LIAADPVEVPGISRSSSRFHARSSRSFTISGFTCSLLGFRACKFAPFCSLAFKVFRILGRITFLPCFIALLFVVLVRKNAIFRR